MYKATQNEQPTEGEPTSEAGTADSNTQDATFEEVK
jgi:hypothetical protein